MRRRKALKKRSLKRHPQRNRHFEIIAHYRSLYEKAGNPTLSVDTKKKELIGNFFRANSPVTASRIGGKNTGGSVIPMPSPCCCDGGGSNAANRYVFKHALEKLANRMGVEIRVCHYPPYESKYNPIEHRFFPHVTRACDGVIFHTVEKALEKLAEPRTTKGLTTTVHLLEGEYQTGEKRPQGAGRA